MELDDLKQTWKQVDKQSTQNQNIMELIHQKSKGPIASLKTAFRKQMRFMLVIMIALAVTNGRNLDNPASNVLFWTYIAFCTAVIILFYFNYRLTGKMEGMDGRVKNNLEIYIAMLEQRLKWQYIGVRIVALVFILLVEVLPFYWHARMLDKWHSLSPLIRFATYAVFLLFQYFASRSIMQRKFGQHLSHLKGLVKELK